MQLDESRLLSLTNELKSDVFGTQQPIPAFESKDEKSDSFWHLRLDVYLLSSCLDPFHHEAVTGRWVTMDGLQVFGCHCFLYAQPLLVRKDSSNNHLWAAAKEGGEEGRLDIDPLLDNSTVYSVVFVSGPSKHLYCKTG